MKIFEFNRVNDQTLSDQRSTINDKVLIKFAQIVYISLDYFKGISLYSITSIGGGSVVEIFTRGRSRTTVYHNVTGERRSPRRAIYQGRHTLSAPLTAGEQSSERYLTPENSSSDRAGLTGSGGSGLCGWNGCAWVGDEGGV